MDHENRPVKRRLGKSLVAALVLAAGAISTPVSALLLNHSVGFSINNQVLGSSPELQFSAMLPLFDPTLGTLQQVDLRYDFDLTLGVAVNNRTLTPLTVDHPSNVLRITGPKFFERFNFNNNVAVTRFEETLDVPAGRPLTVGSINLILPGRAQTLIDLDSVYARTSRPLQIRNIVLRPQGNVAPFVGTGDRLLEFVSLTDSALNLPNSGSFLNGVRSNTFWELDGTVNVTYDYLAAPVVSTSPVSAPPALMLLLAGLAMLGFGKRRNTRLKIGT